MPGGPRGNAHSSFVERDNLGLAALVEHEIERPGHDEQDLVAVGVNPVQTRIAQDRRLGVPLDSSSRGCECGRAADEARVVPSRVLSVHKYILFIIIEHDITLNMTRTGAEPDLDLYRPALQKWMPKAEIRAPGKALVQFDGVVTRMAAGGAFRYLVEVKRHLRYQDVGVVIEQLNRYRATLPPGRAGDRVLLLAPHVRRQQAAAFERAGIDYLDLAGNAHLQAPGLFVHVEGRKPQTELATAPGRPQKGWIKTVMAILIRTELTDAPYRALADEADVALGTVAGCMNDLAARGLLLKGKGRRRVDDRQALVALWVQAYIEGLRPKLKERRFQVRAEGKQEIWARLQRVLAERAHPWALTGADQAARRVPFFRANETEIYAPVRALEDREAQKALVAQPARGGNLLVIEPPGPLAMAGETDDNLPVAPGLLAYAELRYRGTGQALEAAELLLPKVLDDAAP